MREAAMILSTKGRYSVMAMVDLATQPQDKPIGLGSIAERQEIPLAYLEQIFARLKKAGLVASVRGPGGGYTLAKKASDMNVAEIMLAADEPIKMTRCDENSHEGCMVGKARCLTHDLWEGLTAQMRLYLGSITLADVCARRVQQKFPRAHAMPELMMFSKGVTSHQSPVTSEEGMNTVVPPPSGGRLGGGLACAAADYHQQAPKQVAPPPHPASQKTSQDLPSPCGGEALPVAPLDSELSTLVTPS